MPTMRVSVLALALALALAVLLAPPAAAANPFKFRRGRGRGRGRGRDSVRHIALLASATASLFVPLPPLALGQQAPHDDASEGEDPYSGLDFGDLNDPDLFDYSAAREEQEAAIREEEERRAAERKDLSENEQRLRDIEAAMEAARGAAVGLSGDQDDLDIEEGFHMDDFAPSHVLSFELSGRRECFYSDITAAEYTRLPVKVRGSYFVDSPRGPGGMRFEFAKLNPHTMKEEKPALFASRDKEEEVFETAALQYGTHSLCFYGPSGGDSESRIITLALHVGVRRPREHARKAHMTPLENSVRSTHRTLGKVVAEQNFLKARTARHMSTQDSTEWRVMWYTVFESLFMIAVTAGQLVYVQRLVNRRAQRWV